MKHINITSWRGNITDWTELNYIKGGLDDYYADIANVSGNILRHVKGTYPYNQLVQNGNFEDSTGWIADRATLSVSNNEATLTASAQNGYLRHNIDLINGHKYLYCVDLKCDTTDIYCNLSGVGTVQPVSSANYQRINSIISWAAATGTWEYRVQDKRTSDWTAIYAKNAMCIDLTALFGSGNEPADIATAKMQLLNIGINIDEYNEYNEGTTETIDKLFIEDNVNNIYITVR